LPDGTICAVFAPLEQIYFSAEVSDKKTDALPRDIPMGVLELGKESGVLS
jgi:hypothetical protein